MLRSEGFERRRGCRVQQKFNNFFSSPLLHPSKRRFIWDKRERHRRRRTHQPSRPLHGLVEQDGNALARNRCCAAVGGGNGEEEKRRRRWRRGDGPSPSAAVALLTWRRSPPRSSRRCCFPTRPPLIIAHAARSHSGGASSSPPSPVCASASALEAAQRVGR